MRSHELERWTLQVIDQVKAGRPVEDSRVELKATWIEPTRAARRLAGHANASGGEHILWIVGVDEKAGVVGADRKELSAWWAGVQVEFEGLPPELVRSINVPVHDKAVVSLLFEADRVPFVVRNAAFGVEKCPVELEVPWRTATGTRSARRADLLRLLSPLQKTPSLELLAAQLTVLPREQEHDAYGAPAPSRNPRTYTWRVSAQAYVLPRPPTAQVVIPFHRCHGVVLVPEIERQVELTGVFVLPATELGLTNALGFASQSDTLTVASTRYQALIRGPGMVRMDADGLSTAAVDFLKGVQASFRLHLSVVEADLPIVVSATLDRATPKEHEVARWEMKRS